MLESVLNRQQFHHVRTTRKLHDNIFLLLMDVASSSILVFITNRVILFSIKIVLCVILNFVKMWTGQPTTVRPRYVGCTIVQVRDLNFDIGYLPLFFVVRFVPNLRCSYLKHVQ